jgi:hypothetical protein
LVPVKRGCKITRFIKQQLVILINLYGK